MSSLASDLTQSVLEAAEKKNLDRVDTIVLNAVKQLKLSRFRPDQTICISLVYLARVQPKLFLQSAPIQEALKSLLRLGSTKSGDILLPILAANILLAACDSSNVRTIILQKLDQWLVPNQRIPELVLQLLATICIKCQADETTVKRMIEIRFHWLQFLYDNYESYGPVCKDICAKLRCLITKETECELLLAYAKFLFKHDQDPIGFTAIVTGLVRQRPITLKNLIHDEKHGAELISMLLKVYIKFITKSMLPPSQDDEDAKLKDDKKPPTTTGTDPTPLAQQPLKKFKTEEQPVPMDTTVAIPSEPVTTNSLGEDISTDDSHLALGPMIYLKFPDHMQALGMAVSNLEAILTLLAWIAPSEHDDDENKQPTPAEFEQLSMLLFSRGPPSIYCDFALTTTYNLSQKLREQLLLSGNAKLIEFALADTDRDLLIRLLQLFGLSLATLGKIFKRIIEQPMPIDSIRSNVHDETYFYQLVEFYSDSGSLEASDFLKHLVQT